MYVVLLPAVLPLALIGTMRGLSWWEDYLIPPGQPEGLAAASVVVPLRSSALAEMSADDHHRTLMGTAEPGTRVCAPLKRAPAQESARPGSACAPRRVRRPLGEQKET